MTGNVFLDWAVMAVSLFNTILSLWLGLTILLNADRRVWGIWVAGLGLIIAGVFFISHSVIINEGFNVFSQRVDLWWHIGWWPVLALPIVWYIITLWYAGFWDRAHSPLRRRQRSGFVFTILLALALVVMLLVANPLPSLAVDLRYELNPTPLIGGVPLLVVCYPIYILLCIGLSFDALLRPGPSERMMGDLARSRARPWLIATAASLLAVSLLVGGIMFWLTRNAARDLDTIAYAIAIVDLCVASMIAVAILCVGQAVVAYEVFTGKTLPRHGLQRHWGRAIMLAAGFAGVISAGLTFGLSPIYQLLSTAVLIAVFYALLSWRMFAEREHYMHRLRPFVASQRLYEHLLTPSAAAATSPESDVIAPLRALCREVLGARRIVLAAVGPLAPLVGQAVSDSGDHPALPPLSEITGQLASPQTMCLRLDPARYDGAQWAVPLWSERGLIGLLLLGEKNDGGLYMQEEIEIARASGERLIDTRASSALARRLMALQRNRLAETQVVDRRARRILHDDILPQLHAALLTLNGSREPNPEAIALMADVHRRISDLLRDMPSPSPDVARAGLVGALKHSVFEGELANAFDSVTWKIDPQAERHSQTLPALTAEVLFYAAREAIRNAARYGRGQNPQSPLHLAVAVRWETGLKITVEDDGVGLTAAHGANGGGSGQGLALHSTMLAVVGGTLAIESEPGAHTRVQISLPES
jgi:signal transduction histidine kinase